MWWLTRVRSSSMAATLRDGQFVLTRRLWPFSRIRRGDVVVVASPELGRDVVKRVIGLPGETVAIREGSVSVDGRPLAEPYASSSVFTGTYEVPQASYFLLGDNRDASSDSRTWREPYVARGDLRGRLLGPDAGRRLSQRPALAARRMRPSP
jgi:signal peptidase I